MILMVDNYDSFTYNLVQYLGELGAELEVVRNDKVTLDKIGKMRPEAVIISPGPGTPSEAGMSNKIIKAYSGVVPILGVCLGHQCIGEVFGGRIVRAKQIMHGKTSHIYHNGKGIFKDVNNPFEATRYHSLLIENSSVDQKVLDITAKTKDNEIMGVQHKYHMTFGVQFHPESILTAEGKKILKNFITIKKIL